MRTWTTGMLAGTFAGAAATFPMTALMVAGHRGLPWRQRHPLPPAHVTHSLLASVNLDDELSPPQQAAVAIANHFAYGAAMGALYSLVGGTQAHDRPLAAGVGFGLAVWGANYFGLLPTFDLYRSSSKEPLPRTLLLVSAHVVWGASLGLLTNTALRSMERRASLDGTPRAARESDAAARYPRQQAADAAYSPE